MDWENFHNARTVYSDIEGQIMKSLQCLLKFLDYPEGSGEFLFTIHWKIRKSMVLMNKICLSKGWLW